MSAPSAGSCLIHIAARTKTSAQFDLCVHSGSSAPADPPAGPSGEGPADEFEGIDPEFIAALPPDIQAEVLEQQRRERRRRQAAAQQAAAQQAAAAAGPAHGAADMDMASILATFPPEVRDEVLQSADEQVGAAQHSLLACG